MDRDTALKRLAELQLEEDTEAAHIEADGVLCELLDSLGLNEVTQAYDKIGKWYA